ncbi:hypothetical protein JCM3775_003724 [Rhodotorula graminis]
MDDERLYSFAIPPPADDTPSAPVPLAGERFVHPSRVQLSSAAANNNSNKRKHDAAPTTGPAATRAAHSKKRGAPAPIVVEDEHDEPAPAPAAAAGADDEDKPLSHKEKRLAKKRKLAAEAAGLDPDAPLAVAPAAPASTPSSGPAATTIGTTLVGNTPAKAAHGIWVGNMNYATHPRELLAWFAGHGLKDVVRINMPGGKRSHENNRGFAYLDFSTVEDQEAAVACSEKNLDGRKLLIKASSDYSGRPAPALGAAGAAAGGAVKDVLASLDPSALERPDPRAAAHHAAASAAAEGAAPAAAAAAAADGTNGVAPPTLNRTARKILSRQKNPVGPTLFLGNLGFETTVDDIRDMFDRNQVRSSEWAPKGKEGKKARKAKGKGKGKEGEEDEEEAAEAGDEDKAETDRDDVGSDDSDESSSEEEDGDDEGGERDAGDKKKRREDKKAKGPRDLAKAKDAGIRKIRIGTFEDTGKCKGWAFVDFHLAAQSTRALLNLHNHQLNGRKLNVEYASAEAVRRGQLGSRAVSKQHGRQRREAPVDNGADNGYGERAGAGRRKRGDREWDDGDVRSFAAEAVADAAAAAGGPPQRQRREKQPRGAGREPQALPGGKRAKPGAALAMAQRASEAIVASTGRKVTFD